MWPNTGYVEKSNEEREIIFSMDKVNYSFNVVMNFLTKGRLYGILLLSK